MTKPFLGLGENLNWICHREKKKFAGGRVITVYIQNNSNFFCACISRASVVKTDELAPCLSTPVVP